MSFRIEPHAQPIPGYRLIERLGSGGFGEVWKTEAPGGIFKAIKFIHGDLRTKDNDLVRYAEQELKALNRVKTVRHPYLLSLDRIDIVEGRLMIIMELADCNLWDRFRFHRQAGRPGIPRDELLRYMIESAEVLDLMNDTFNLQHLDIKPQNLFLLHQHVKVADFGQVKDLQGTQAEVTGGITPVYAAPETFDGYISKFCDQYSLACVYQELLTGIRPFEGTSLQQLLLQHVEQPPNLDPLPFEERAPMLKALAKKADQRFPSCTEFVQSLIVRAVPVSAPARAAAPPVGTAVAGQVSGLNGKPGVEQSGRIEVAFPDEHPSPSFQPSMAISVELTGTPIGRSGDTPLPKRTTQEPPALIAPPEQIGSGSLRPTLVIGLGGQGLSALRHLQRTIRDKCGHPDRLPIIRTLYIDTDPADLEAATKDRPSDGLPGLLPDQIFAARLHRAGHYLKPRLSGRSLIEGWFDSQLLYRLSRVPVTGGYRIFGRLAYCDAFRGIAARLQSEIATALDPNAYNISRERTGLTLATNRPRVYVIGGLGGGTAGGMFIDLAYTVRAQLKYLGYSDPDLVGLFFLPSDVSSGEGTMPCLANTYAALTELNHYSRDESIFFANYDDRYGVVKDSGKPFRTVCLLPGGQTPTVPGGPSNGSGPITYADRRSGIHAVSRVRPMARSGLTPAPKQNVDPASLAAEIVRFEVLSPVGRFAEASRPGTSDSGPLMVRTIGTAKLSWPRGDIVNRTSKQIARAVLANWVTVDVKRARDVIPAWTADAWSRMGLDPDPLISRLIQASNEAARGPIHKMIDRLADNLTPKGWLTRSPDSAAVIDTVNTLLNFLGHPVASGNPSRFEEVICPVTVEICERAKQQLSESLPRLCDDSNLRLSGTEEAANQFMATIDRLVARYQPLADQHAQQSRVSLEFLMGVSAKSRKGTTQEVADATRQFGTCRIQAVILKEVVAIYKNLKGTLRTFLKDASACRQRLETELTRLVTVESTISRPRLSNELLPAGCPSVDAAVESFVNSLNDDDLNLVEQRIQASVIERYDGVFNACLNTTDGIQKLIDLLQEEIRAYLDARLNDVDFLSMLAANFHTEDAARSTLGTAYRDAEPNIAGSGPWSKSEISILLSTAATADLASSVMDATNPILAEGKDEIAYYRELPCVPMAALPHLGPNGENAYQMACEMPQGNPHARGDVPKWTSIDAS